MTGAEMIAAERRRQIEIEGWTPEYDEQHTDGSLVEAAVMYARYCDASRFMPPLGPPMGWPWDEAAWKPCPRLRGLTRAGALLAAEIDRLIAAGETE